LTFGGYILGHAHKGRPFLSSVHGPFASLLFIPIVSQLVLGIYLKLHIHDKSLRPYAVIVHGIIGKTYPILSWIQMLFGFITFRGYCRGEHLSEFFCFIYLTHLFIYLFFFFSKNKTETAQCLGHYIMGSGFIAYATIMTIILLVGEQWVRHSGRSPEWWDSWYVFLPV
jgi:hypothetical protein